MAKPADSFDWTDKSVLVTGGAGFIGSHLVELLVDASAQVTVFDTLGSGARDNLASVADDVTLLEYDVRDDRLGGLPFREQYRCGVPFRGQCIRSAVGRITVV